jgi:hypothetical protein
VELTLHSLAGALRGSPLARGDLPDLREDHHALAHSGDPATERYALVNVELKTLREELLNWLAREEAGVDAGRRTGVLPHYLG